MASRIETFDVTIPASTPIATPQTTALNFNDGIIERLEILIPPGPSGLVGFRILHSGTTVIPYAYANFIIADNEVLKWDLENYPTGSAWSIQAYNTDVYAHTLYLRFFVIETQRYAFTAVTPIPITQAASSAVEPVTTEVL